MVKRVAVMFATILIALGGLIGWGLVKVLSRNGDIWKFRAPYP